jgi:putative transposase
MEERYLNERVEARTLEVLRARNVAGDRLGLGELVREGARLMLETALELEVEEFLGRGRNERTGGGGRGYRNGTYARSVKTLAGEIPVKKPKVSGNKEEFSSSVLPAWRRRCEELSAIIPTLYLEGLSTRDIRRATGVFWGETGLSRSSVSRLNQRLHEEFEQWRRRDLSGEGLLFLYLDALYAGVRFDGSEKQAVLVTHGIREDGTRSVLSIRFGGRESTRSWSEVLHDLVARNLHVPLLILSDGNAGLIAACREVWPDVPRQRCIHHRNENILDKVPKSVRDEVRTALNQIWYADTFEKATEAARTFSQTYRRRFEAAVSCLTECLPECLSFFKFPQEFWQRIRTTNLLERCFKEVRRRTKVVGRFPSESSALAVIYGILTIDATKWRGLRLTPATVLHLKEVSHNLTVNPIVIDLEVAA